MERYVLIFLVFRLSFFSFRKMKKNLKYFFDWLKCTFPRGKILPSWCYYRKYGSDAELMRYDWFAINKLLPAEITLRRRKLDFHARRVDSEGVQLLLLILSAFYVHYAILVLFDVLRLIGRKADSNICYMLNLRCQICRETNQLCSCRAR